MAIPERRSWRDEDSYWSTNYRTRPYVSDTNRDYAFYQPGYHYGFDASRRFQGQRWDDVEADLSHNWQRYEHRGQSTWDQVKDAVHDAWDRMTGRITRH